MSAPREDLVERAEEERSWAGLAVVETVRVAELAKLGAREPALGPPR